MYIHELPSGTLTTSDVAAIDNGTSTRKYNLGAAMGTLTESINSLSSVNGSGFNKNFLLVSLNNPQASYHQRWNFSYTSTTVSDFTNVPTALATDRTVIGYREVRYIGSSHVLVIVTELWPNYGRQHFNFYNSGSWSGWRATAIPS